MNGYQTAVAETAMGDSIHWNDFFLSFLCLAVEADHKKRIFSLRVSCEQTNTFINELTKKVWF